LVLRERRQYEQGVRYNWQSSQTLKKKTICNGKYELLENNQNINCSQDSMQYSSHVFEPFRENYADTAAGSVDLENRDGVRAYEVKEALSARLGAAGK